jgi:hypothetical protein
MADWDPLVNEIFVRAIEAGPPAERAAVVERSCRDDADLRREVESLLAAHDLAGTFLDHPAPELAAIAARASGAAPTRAEEAAGSAVATVDCTETAARPAGPARTSDAGPPPTDGPRPIAEGPG